MVWGGILSSRPRGVNLPTVNTLLASIVAATAALGWMKFTVRGEPLVLPGRAFAPRTGLGLLLLMLLLLFAGV